ncbi:aminoglycoside phosphotransferase family protein [Halobacteriales archaeon SW_7_71_33]|nr:MAG: aminoglycoside phosphotransferase family protein [Halobacteriales archaeon SW_7_71_33]
MTDPVPARLRERHNRVVVVDRLHDVPPNEVYLVEVDGRRAVLKRSTGPRGDAAVEGRAQRLAARESPLPTPAVLWVGRDAFLAAFDPDAPEEGADPTPEWCRVAGRGLARLHSIGFDRHGLLRADGDPANSAAGLRVDADGGTWPEAVLTLLGEFRRSVADTEYAAVVDEVAEFVRERPDRFVAAGDDGAESEPEPVLVHGWFSPEHVAVRDGAVRSVVDFEHAMAGAAEYDLWRLAVPTFGLGTEREDCAAWRRFREAYESVRPLPAGFEARADAVRLVVAVSYLDSLAVQRGVDGNRDRADAVRDAVRERLAALRA